MPKQSGGGRAGEGEGGGEESSSGVDDGGGGGGGGDSSSSGKKRAATHNMNLSDRGNNSNGANGDQPASAEHRRRQQQQQKKRQRRRESAQRHPLTGSRASTRQLKVAEEDAKSTDELLESPEKRRDQEFEHEREQQQGQNKKAQQEKKQEAQQEQQSKPNQQQQKQVKRSDVRFKLGYVLKHGKTSAWKVVRELGSGGYGRVYLCLRVDPEDLTLSTNDDGTNSGSSNTPNSLDGATQERGSKGNSHEQATTTRAARKPELCALKIEANHKGRISYVRHECRVYKAMRGSTRAPRLYLAGSCKGMHYLGLQILGKSMGELRKRAPNRRFDLPTTVYVARGMLACLAALHRRGIVHRDVKAGNFAVGYGDKWNRIYIFDFGLARFFRENDAATGTLKPAGTKVPFVGTTRYGSMAAQLGQEQSCRDDLKSWLYAIVEMYKSRIPWRELEDKTEVFLAKKQHSWDDLFADMPPQFRAIATHIEGLAFGELADYTLLERYLDEVVRPHMQQCPTPQLNWQRRRFRRDGRAVIERVGAAPPSCPGCMDTHDWRDGRRGDGYVYLNISGSGSSRPGSHAGSPRNAAASQAGQHQQQQGTQGRDAQGGEKDDEHGGDGAAGTGKQRGDGGGGGDGHRAQQHGSRALFASPLTPRPTRRASLLRLADGGVERAEVEAEGETESRGSANLEQDEKEEGMKKTREEGVKEEHEDEVLQGQRRDNVHERTAAAARRTAAQQVALPTSHRQPTATAAGSDANHGARARDYEDGIERSHQHHNYGAVGADYDTGVENDNEGARAAAESGEQVRGTVAALLTLDAREDAREGLVALASGSGGGTPSAVKTSPLLTHAFRSAQRCGRSDWTPADDTGAEEGDGDARRQGEKAEGEEGRKKDEEQRKEGALAARFPAQQQQQQKQDDVDGTVATPIKPGSEALWALPAGDRVRARVLGHASLRDVLGSSPVPHAPHPPASPPQRTVRSRLHRRKYDKCQGVVEFSFVSA